MPNKVVFESTSLCTGITVVTAVFLLFRERHLLLECGFAFYIQLTSHLSTCRLRKSFTILKWDFHFFWDVLCPHLCQNLLLYVCMSQISEKKLKKYEKEYHTIREQQEQQEAPIERYEVDLSCVCLCVRAHDASLLGFTQLHSWLCAYEYLHDLLGRACVCPYAFNLG